MFSFMTKTYNKYFVFVCSGSFEGNPRGMFSASKEAFKLYIIYVLIWHLQLQRLTFLKQYFSVSTLTGNAYKNERITQFAEPRYCGVDISFHIKHEARITLYGLGICLTENQTYGFFIHYMVVFKYQDRILTKPFYFKTKVYNFYIMNLITFGSASTEDNCHCRPQFQNFD